MATMASSLSPMEVAKRRQNERKFGTWRHLPDSGRLYSYEVKGRSGWLAKYVKQVDEKNRRSCSVRKCSMATGIFVKCTRSFRSILVIERSLVRNHDHARHCGVQLRDYLQRRTTRMALVDWAERAM